MSPNLPKEPSSRKKLSRGLSTSSTNHRLERQIEKVSEQLRKSLLSLRNELFAQNASLRVDVMQNQFYKSVNVEEMKDFMNYQMQYTPQWMGVSILEVARKAIDHSRMNLTEKQQAFTDLQNYYDHFVSVCRASTEGSFDDGIALADHARETVYDLLTEYGLVESRHDFNIMRNAGVMWRLTDRMSIETNLHWPTQDKKVSITSSSWPKVLKAQDEALMKPLSSRGGRVSKIVRAIIRSVQRLAIKLGFTVRAQTGSQERDWYAPNAQVTRYQIDNGPKFECWTNGDFRSNYAYDAKTIDNVVWRNMAQLLLNATGIDLGAVKNQRVENGNLMYAFTAIAADGLKEQIAKFSESYDVYGRPIHLHPICLMNECQSFVNQQMYPLTGPLVRKASLVDEEHRNIMQRELAIEKINVLLEKQTGVSQTLFSLNTPLAVHGRKFFTYHDKIAQTFSAVASRLLDNYASVLCLGSEEAGDLGLSMSDLQQSMQDYIDYPHQDKMEGLTDQFSKLRDRAMRFIDTDGVSKMQADKVIRSLCCLHSTLHHWRFYHNSKVNAPEEVINFAASLTSSCALLNDACMINIKCKSGKDRTGVQLQSAQTCFDYWADGRHFHNADNPHGLPCLQDHYDCESEQSLTHFNTLLASGAWPTAVAQDCQCAALKSLGSPMHTAGNENTLSDRVQNLVGVGALSEKMRLFVGKDMLKYHNKRSQYNGDFHNKVKPHSREKIQAMFDKQRGLQPPHPSVGQ